MQELVRSEDQDGKDENQDELQDQAGDGTLHGLADSLGPVPPDTPAVPPSTSSALAAPDEVRYNWREDVDEKLLDGKHAGPQRPRREEEEAEDEAVDDLRCQECTLLIRPPMFRCTECHALYHQGCLPGDLNLFAIGWLCSRCQPTPPSTSSATSSSSSPTARSKKKQKTGQR